MKQLYGVMPPMITPFDENEEIDYSAHACNVEKWIQAGVSGLVVNGSNSETCFLTKDERDNLLQITVDINQNRVPIVVGTGAESTRETIALTERAAKLGADFALVLTPCFYLNSNNKKQLIKHFRDVADKSPIPILLYNVPKFTNVNLSVDVVCDLSHHSNIYGIKDSAGNVTQLYTLKRNTADDFVILAGTASMWLYALEMGLSGGIFALANCVPKMLVQIQNLFNEKKFLEAEELFEKSILLNTAVTATFGIAGLKYVTSKFGFTGGCLRRPLAQLDNGQKKELDEIFSDI